MEPVLKVNRNQLQNALGSIAKFSQKARNVEAVLTYDGDWVGRTPVSPDRFELPDRASNRESPPMWADKLLSANHAVSPRRGRRKPRLS